MYAAHQKAMMGDDGAGEQLHLVPCRWSRTGWKYVNADPKVTNFFNNPNRLNSIGFSPNRQDGKFKRPVDVNVTKEFASTTYARSFDPSK